MSVPAYPAYKDSGVEWLGEVPAHWSSEPFKWHIKVCQGGVWGDDPDGNDDTIVLRSTEQTVDGRWQIQDPALRKLSPAERDSALLKPGDLLVTKSSGSSLHIGKTTVVTAEIAALQCCYSNFMQRVRLRPSYLSSLAWYVLNGDIGRGQFDLASNSTTGLANLNGTMIGQLMVPVPPAAEQVAIAVFLDRETGKIDALVEEQRRLIALLKEKRQAVISHAVTKGLNPAAPTKDSGIEWLGDIPVHWEVGKLFYGSRLQSGYAFASSDFGDEGIPVVRMNNLNRGILDLSEAARVPESALNASVALKEGDILWGMSGSIGNFALVAADDVPCQLNQRVGRFIVNRSRMEPEFLLVWIQSDAFSQQILLAVTGTAQLNVSAEQVQGTMVAFPPLTEQRAIAAHVSLSVCRFDILVGEAQRAITLLQERRAALISAAVTGKIDVRGLAAASVPQEAA